MVGLYLPLVFTERVGSDLRVISKISFFISGKYFVRTIFMAVTLLIPFLMLTTPFFFLLFLFIGISTPLLIIAAITKKPREFLQETEGKVWLK